MIKKHLKTLIITSAITLIPALVGLVLWKQLPELLPIHWGLNGADNFASKWIAVFLLPLIMLAFQWIMAFITLKLKGEMEQNKKIITLSLWIVPILTLFVSGAIFLAGLDFDVSPLVPAIVSVPMGVLFALLGNILPKATQNKYFGIKIPSTFKSEANWNATHRFAGKLWFGCGILILFCSLVPIKFFFYPLIAISLIAVTAPIIYSLNYQKRHPEKTETKIVTSKKGTIIAIAVTVAFLTIIFSIVGVITFTGSITTEFGETSFTVDTELMSPLTVNFADVEKVEYLETSDAGNRIYGVGSAKILAGNFKNEEFGKYTRYTYLAEKSCVVITAKENNILVINGKNAEETKELYNKLLEATNESN